MSIAEATLSTAEKMKELALEYLNENYDDNFTAKSYSGKDWATSYSQVTFYSEKYPDYSVVKVQIHENDDGSYYFIDNYYQCYMYDDAIAYFEDIVDGIEPLTVKIRFQGYVYSDRLNGATSFAEWIANETCLLEVFFITQENLSDEDVEKLVQDIADNKIQGRIWFITTSHSDNLVDVSISDIMNNQSTYVENMNSYYIDNEYEVEKE